MWKIIIAGSSSLQDRVQYWKKYWSNKGWNILDCPDPIEGSFMEQYPDVYKNFYKNIAKADRFFLMNDDKKWIAWYIWAQSFAELSYALVQNSLHNNDIDILLAKMPSEQVACYDEIKRWLEFGWIDIYNVE